MSLQSHVTAFLGVIRSDVELAESTFEGVVKGEPDRYVVVFAPSPGDSAHRLTGPQARQDWTFVTHSVGGTPEQARFVADRVRMALLGKRLSVVGRSCWPIHHPVGVPMQRDDDGSAPLFYVIDEWDFTSMPA